MNGNTLLDVSRLGLIELFFYETTIIGVGTTFHPRHSMAFETGPVPEKAKKVGWHRASYVSYVLPMTYVHMKDTDRRGFAWYMCMVR